MSSCWNLVKFIKENLNYLRLLSKQGQKWKYHGHNPWTGVLIRFLRLDSLEQILVKFPWILEVWIINYELITDYQRLVIKYVFNN
jgi:hypothetical protein